MTIAGSEMQCLEIYTGEAYTLPLQVTDSVGDPINCSDWTLSLSAKFYTASTVTYPSASDVVLGDLILTNPQPSIGAGTYTESLDAAWDNPTQGLGYITIPATLTGGTGSPNPTPTLTLANNANNSILVILTLVLSRPDVYSVMMNVSKEPIGIIVRYQ